MAGIIFKSIALLMLLLITSIDTSNAQTDNYWEGKVRIINPGPPLNLRDADYSPFIAQNGLLMFFTSKRNGNFEDDMMNENSHDVWLAVKQKPEDSSFIQIFNISPPDKANSLINTVRNEGSVCISSDNKALYFTGCNRPDGNGSCDIYIALIEFQDNTIIIKNVFHMGPMINTKNFESAPSISPDNMKLFFTKINTGTSSTNFGFSKPQQDIWYSDFDTVMKIWKEAKPLEKINTKGDDMGPYMCPDNKTLIFSSNGRKDSYGGLDFYYTVLDSNGEWSEPKNLGKPFNTKEDDLGITFTGTGDIAYFSSKRDDIQGYQDDYDIYMAYLSEPFINEVRIISWQQFSDANVTIDIYDSTGNPVNTINMGLQKSGRHSFNWDGKDGKGKACPSGVYSFEVTIGDNMPEPPRVLRIK